MRSFFEKLAAKPEYGVVLLGLVLLLSGNWILPLTDRDEARFGEASREMIQRGDYVVPWFNGQWRFDKPILIYWCQSTCYRLLGANDFAARLPSALFTTATALILVRWGRKIADPRTAFMAGAMFLTGLHVAVIGRVATADMAMVFFFTLAVWSGWELTRPQGRFRGAWWATFYITLALGFLAKGPEAWLPVIGLVAGRFFRKDGFRLSTAETIGGLCLAGGLAALWGIPAITQTRGQYFDVGMGEHVWHRSTGINDGHGLAGAAGYIALLPLYFLTFLVSFLPWTTRKPIEFDERLEHLRQKGFAGAVWAWILGLLLGILHIPLRIWRWWPERQRDEAGWYLLVQALIVFAVFSCVATKLPHYTMPAFPCLALWLAMQLRTQADAFAWFAKRLTVMVVIIFVVTLGFTTAVRGHLLTENVWNAVSDRVRPETKVGCFGYNEPSLVWRFRSVVTNTVALGEAKHAKDFLTNSPPYILVLPTKDLATLPDTNGTLIPVRGLDMVKCKNWDLTAIVR